MTVEELIDEFDARNDPELDVMAEVFNEEEEIIMVAITGVRFEDGKFILETERP